MRSRLLYVVPIMLTAGSAEAQYYPYPGPPPVQVIPYNVDPYTYMQADGPNVIYPVKRYIINRTPVKIVTPAPIINNNIIVNPPPPRIVYVNKPRVRKAVKRSCGC